MAAAHVTEPEKVKTGIHYNITGRGTAYKHILELDNAQKAAKEVVDAIPDGTFGYAIFKIKLLGVGLCTVIFMVELGGGSSMKLIRDKSVKGAMLICLGLHGIRL